MGLVLAFVYAVGGVVCHQMPERSFFIDGHQLPVCARCTGLYLSAALGLSGWFALKIAWRGRPIAVSPRVALAALLVGAAPTVLSFAAGVLGIADGTNVWRTVLAIPLGASAGAIVGAVVAKDLR